MEMDECIPEGGEPSALGRSIIANDQLQVIVVDWGMNEKCSFFLFKNTAKSKDTPPPPSIIP